MRLEKLRSQQRASGPSVSANFFGRRLNQQSGNRVCSAHRAIITVNAHILTLDVADDSLLQPAGAAFGCLEGLRSSPNPTAMMCE